MEGKIKFDQLSDTVFVRLPDGRAISAPRGSSVQKILEIVQDDYDAQIVGAVVNGSLKELTYTVDFESKIVPVAMNTADGMRIYRRSLIMLLETAFAQIHPDKYVVIDHSVSFGGYFCRIEGKEQLSQEDLDELNNKMRELVEQDIQVERKEVNLQEAIAYFKAHGHNDKAQLLKHRKKDYMVMYYICLLYTSPSPRDRTRSRMPSSA